MYKLLLDKRVYKDLDAIPVVEVVKIQRAMGELEKDPRPFGCQKLQGYRDRYRIRQGIYRIVYSIDDKDKTLKVMLVSHRKDAYRK